MFMAVSLETRDATTCVPGFYPRDGTRFFWQPFAARIVGIDRMDEYLKSARLARVCVRACRGVSYKLQMIATNAGDVRGNSALAARLRATQTRTRRRNAALARISS